MEKETYYVGPERRMGAREAGRRSEAVSHGDLRDLIVAQGAQLVEKHESLRTDLTNLRTELRGVIDIYHTGTGLFMFLRWLSKVVAYVGIIGGAFWAAVHWLRMQPPS